MHLVQKAALFFFILIPIFCLAEIPRVSLLTCGPGDELYTTFGHSGIRIKHDATNYDVVYGYGTFDFRQPNFYVKFCQGKLMYYLSVTSFDRFMAEYSHFKRNVDEQILDLDSTQTYAIIEYLENNISGDSKFYKYDFFFDNCSTRIRDIIEIEYDEKWLSEVDNRSYRNLLDEKTVPLVWSDFGIDIVIGAVADKPYDFRTQMFLPDYLKEQFSHASIGGKELVKEERILLRFAEENEIRSQPPFITPFKVFASLFLVFLLLFFSKQTWAQKTFNLFSFTWILGMTLCFLIISLLWFFTDHLATKSNWNLLWMSPLFVVLLFRFKGYVQGRIKNWIPIFIIGLNVLTILTWSFIPQQFHLAFLPMMLINVIVCLHFVRKNQKVILSSHKA